MFVIRFNIDRKLMLVKINMRKSLILLLFVLQSIVVWAQKLTVSSFEVSQGDILARTAATCRYDTNDKYCALIKVGIALDGVEFECSGGVRDVVKKTGEYWVYIPQNNSKLRILHKNYTPLEINFYDYGIGKVQSGVTYVLTLIKPITATTQQKQVLLIRYTPSSATVLVDNKMVKGSNGVAKTTMPVGQHSYVVFCDGYESEEGTVKLKASAPSDLQIRLSKEVTVALSNANDVMQDNVSTSSTSSSQSATTSSGFSSTPSLSSGGNTISIPVKNGITINMVKVEAGTFKMGATSEMENPYSWEQPVHQVTLTRDYYICKYEVSQALWKIVMGSNPSNLKGDNLPVEQVSWNDCQEFISKLNSMTGKKFRLPTEAEWEYAARGGRKSRVYQYSGSSNISNVAWYENNSGSKTHPVGTKQANELGIYDMSGNVWEWCQDRLGPYVSSSQTNPTGAVSGSRRVGRGGGCSGDARYCRSSCRGIYSPDDRFSYLGLRLVLSE